MTPALASFVAVLTVIGWGGGELFGHGVNRYLTRRSVRRWLEAERSWKRAERSRQIEAGKPRRGPMPRRTPGCRPGVQCWQGCDNCRPERMVEREKEYRRRNAMAVAVAENPSVQAILEDKAARLADHASDFRAISGYRCPLTKQDVELYKETIAPGRVRFSEYRKRGNKRWFVRSWDESESRDYRDALECW